MSERDPLVAGNWKMNGDAGSLDLLLDGVLSEALSVSAQAMQCSGFPALCLFGSSSSKAARIHCWGRFSGCRSANARRCYRRRLCGDGERRGVRFVLVGHSERRTLFAESDELVTDKFEQCGSQGLVPIVCVGETLEERRRDRTIEVVTRQLRAVTSRVGLAGFDGAMIAYEPVWAIGTGESATPEQAEEVHAGLRKCLAELDEDLSNRTRILYGGSVTADNAMALFGMKNVDGALVGGASLKANSFAEICKAAEES